MIPLTIVSIYHTIEWQHIARVSGSSCKYTGKCTCKLSNRKGISNSDSDIKFSNCCTSDGIAMQRNCGVQISKLGNWGTTTCIPKFYRSSKCWFLNQCTTCPCIRSDESPVKQVAVPYCFIMLMQKKFGNVGRLQYGFYVGLHQLQGHFRWFLVVEIIGLEIPPGVLLCTLYKSILDHA